MTDLPGPWSAARRATVKAVARGSALGAKTRPAVRVLLDPTTGGRIVLVKGASYRCKQAVEAFVLSTEGGIAILVQPADLSPTVVAKCSCLLDIAVAVPGAVSTAPAPHEQIRAVYLRGDRYGSKTGIPPIERIPISSPVQVGSWGSLWDAPWKRAAVDAWDDYKETFRSYWS